MCVCVCAYLFYVALCNLILFRCGPLVRSWYMRYEAKHSYFKQLARVLGNFKNISKTLASRHQHYMCYEMMNPSTYMRNQITYIHGRYYAAHFCFCIFFWVSRDRHTKQEKKTLQKKKNVPDTGYSSRRKKKKKKKVHLPGFEPRLSGLPAQAHYLQTTWKVLIGENCIIQVSP